MHIRSFNTIKIHGGVACIFKSLLYTSAFNNKQINYVANDLKVLIGEQRKAKRRNMDENSTRKVRVINNSFLNDRNFYDFFIDNLNNYLDSESKPILINTNLMHIQNETVATSYRVKKDKINCESTAIGQKNLSLSLSLSILAAYFSIEVQIDS